MGEEKKPAEEEKKMEEKKADQEAEKETKEEKDSEKQAETESKESKDPNEEEKKAQEIVLRIFMHCEGCARKVRHYLKGFDGVEDVTTDYKTSKVVVKGEKADPLKVLERIRRKTRRKVELLSPIPVPAPAPDPKDVPEKKPEENPKAEEKKDERVTVVLRVYMHCEACAMEIQKRIHRMKGVESAEPDVKASQVTVKGVFEPTKLVQYIHKRTGKHVAVVSQDPEPKKTEDNNEEKKEENSEKKGGEEKPKEGEKKQEGKDGNSKDEKKEKKGKNNETKDGGGGKTAEGDNKAAAQAPAAAEGTKVVEIMQRNEYCYQAPRYPMEMYAYPPQIFSDENPNACTVM